MSRIIVKRWIYEDVQSKAQTYMRTLCWDKVIDYNTKGEEIECFALYPESIVKETEKAICFNCKYWSTKGREVSFKVFTGHNVWIPKSAILHNYLTPEPEWAV